MTSDTLAAEGRRLLEAATPGPWFALMDDYTVAHVPSVFIPDQQTVALCAVGDKAGHNAHLIAWLHTHAPELLTALEERDRLAALVYVPGVFRCAKCNLRLVSSTLNAHTGGVKANTAPQTCPNGCGPMWPVTEREAGNQLCDAAETTADELNRLRSLNGAALSHADACVLSICFNRAGDLRNPQHARINEWLKGLIARLRAEADNA